LCENDEIKRREENTLYKKKSNVRTLGKYFSIYLSDIRTLTSQFRGDARRRADLSFTDARTR